MPQDGQQDSAERELGHSAPDVGDAVPQDGQQEEQAERLHKVMARCGVASRRSCEELIAAGRVTVNGTIARVGDRAEPADLIEVDGAVVTWDAAMVHYLVNKPRGVLSAASDDRGRRCVTDLVPAAVRVYPVGRLDADSEGLIIVTNDGELTHRLTHPSWGVPKEYLAHVDGMPARGALAQLRTGVALDDGPTAPAVVSMPQPSVLRIVIHEGRNRQIRRMCDAVGHPVVRLVRTRIGPLTDPALRPGGHRPLTADEVRELHRAAKRLSR
ncbi:MAG: pseudouridine synthase [Acidimicrobiaceae bacterium]|nr:pseudouridine synthase [Acidimicrobiaceae bacterium]